MPEEKEAELEPEDDEVLNKLSQIRAVNIAVLENLEVRSKRDDDKVSQAVKKITTLMDKAWYKHLGNISATITEYRNTIDDLGVTHLQTIKQLQSYNAELNQWASAFEHNRIEIATLQQLNNNLSIQLKDVDTENKKLIAKQKDLKRENEALQARLGEKSEENVEGMEQEEKYE